MATSLASKSIGAPDNSFAWYLQSGGISLATGFPVALGNGTETQLWLDSSGIGIRSAGGFVSHIESLASAARLVKLADAPGVLQPAAQGIITAEVTNSTTTPEPIAALSLPLEANALYEIEAILLAKSAATTTGVQLRLTGPAAQTDYLCYEIMHLITNTLLTTNTRRQYFTAFDSNMANLDAPAAASLFPIFLRGIVKTTGTTPASNLGLSFNSEVGASTVTIAAGSLLRAKRLA